MRELRFVELELETAAELPERALLRRHRLHAHRAAHAQASYGSASNANDTQQSNSNAQSVIGAGTVGGR
jgi:hypothetical protein